MSTQKKRHRPHDIRDRAIVETQRIEKAKPSNSTQTKNSTHKATKSKSNRHQPHTHAYEYSQPIERSKGVGAQLQRAIKQKIDIHNNTV